MRKILIITAIIMVTVGLSGCGEKAPEFQNDFIAKYASYEITGDLNAERPVTQEEIENMTELNVNLEDDLNIEDLKMFTNLEKLKIRVDIVGEVDETVVEEISLDPIMELEHLKDLYIGGTNLSSLDKVKQLKQLTSLSIFNNEITDISDLVEMQNLEQLALGEEVDDISPIKELKNLTDFTLYPKYNYEERAYIDYSLISELTQLTKFQLNVSAAEKADISVVSSLNNLTELKLYSNGIDLKDITNCDKLTSLLIDGEGATSFEVLKDFNLTKLELGWLYDYTDLEMIRDLTELKELTVTLQELTNADAVTSLVNLEKLTFIYCSLDNIDFVADLPNLTDFEITENHIQYDVSPLLESTSVKNLRLDKESVTNPEIFDDLFTEMDLETFSYY